MIRVKIILDEIVLYIVNLIIFCNKIIICLNFYCFYEGRWLLYVFGNFDVEIFKDYG